MSDKPNEPAHVRRTDSSERFVAFTFAAADLVTEVDTAGDITFAAGAFRTRFGRLPETFIGTSVRALVCGQDHEALDAALNLLAERGRLLPLTIRLANKSRTQMALAGIRLAPEGRPVRLCLTFALLPAPAGRVMHTSPSFTRAMVTRLHAGATLDLALLEVSGPGGGPAGGSAGHAVGTALSTLAPNAVASELAPGRFGLLTSDGNAMPPDSIAAALQAALLDQGLRATVSSRNLAPAEAGLSSTQAARTLRLALDAFARAGTIGLDAAGFTLGLASYLKDAMQHTGAMRRAITERRFELSFQPILRFADRSLHHYEALLRPQPVPGVPGKTPQEFVLLAETIGLAPELDLAVVAVVCSAATHANAPIAFNLSGQSMQDPRFRDKLLTKLVNEPARKANRLVAEMTETAQIEDIPEAAKTAHMLRDLGIPFCLDDFGAGGADMRVLHSMPADIVKLDGSYTAGVVADGRERAFVAGMIEMAHAAGAAVVAEWVETEEEAQVLASMGAEYGQGWLFGRPAPLPGAPPTLLAAEPKIPTPSRRRGAETTFR